MVAFPQKDRGWGKTREPIFIVTNLRKLAVEAYSLMAVSFVLGLVLGALLWR